MKWFAIRNTAYDASKGYDSSLLWCIFALMIFGFIMVTSASMPIIDTNPFAYAKKEILYLMLSLFLLVTVISVPMQRWQQGSVLLLLLVIVMLTAVLLVGSAIKGASRWLSLGIFNFQPAEFAKLALFCYLASYLTRKSEELQRSLWGFLKPMAVMLIFSLLLLKQPDLGTVIVLFVVTLGILFIAGARLWQFIAIVSTGIFAMIILILIEPYRFKRILTFLEPWQDPTGSGYQLISSLMAIGNGELLGQGLGNSVRKLGYLPEASTDFIFSIIAEELGFIGVVFVLYLLLFLAIKAMSIGYRALKMGMQFSGYLACEIGIWLGFQTFVNIGVSSGMLPTKGLTLPFISYGGSSLLIMTTAVAMLLRTDFECRELQTQARVRNN